MIPDIIQANLSKAIEKSPNSIAGFEDNGIVGRVVGLVDC